MSKMFEGIEAMLVEEEDTFVCVFIDEVETITARREQAITGNEPLDAMRAVNTLLTALDRLRHHMNIIILCTSNLISALVSDYGSITLNLLSQSDGLTSFISRIVHLSTGLISSNLFPTQMLL